MDDGWQSEHTDGPTRGWRQRSVVGVVVGVVVVIAVGLLLYMYLLL